MKQDDRDGAGSPFTSTPAEARAAAWLTLAGALALLVVWALAVAWSIGGLVVSHAIG